MKASLINHYLERVCAGNMALWDHNDSLPVLKRFDVDWMKIRNHWKTE